MTGAGRAGRRAVVRRRDRFDQPVRRLRVRCGEGVSLLAVLLRDCEIRRAPDGGIERVRAPSAAGPSRGPASRRFVSTPSFTSRSAKEVHVEDHHATSVRVRLAILLSLVAAVPRASAQRPTPITDPPADTVGVRSAKVPPPRLGRNTALILTGALGIGVAVSLVDSRLLSGAQPAAGQLQRTSAIGSLIGGPGPITLGALLYAAGRGTGDTFVTNIGREVVRAVLATGGLTALTKGVVGRSRPFASPGDADEYAPGRGFLGGAHSSFPSGHTAAAFATATVLARELSAAHPTGRWVLNPLLFGAASFVGWSASLRSAALAE